MRITAQHKMEDLMADSNRLEKELLDTLNPRDGEVATAEHDFKFHQSSSCQGNRKWWVPLLLRMESEKNFSYLLSLQSTIEQGKDAYSRFKSFRDIKGLILLISFEFEELQTARQEAIRSKTQLFTPYIDLSLILHYPNV